MIKVKKELGIPRLQTWGAVNNGHDIDCGCGMCEEDRISAGAETMFDKEQREKNEQYIREYHTCNCPEMAAYHLPGCLAGVKR